MSDNIIDFNDLRHDKDEDSQTFDLSPDAVLERLSSLPENAMMAGINAAIGTRITKLMFLAEIGARATEGLQAAGFDPGDFDLDEESLNRYLASDLEIGEEVLWNGPWFDWLTDDATIRLVSTIKFSEAREQGIPVDMTMNLLKLDDDADQWEIFNGEGWTQDGPPADFFDDMDDFDDEDEWDEDWDDDEDEDWDDDEDDEDEDWDDEDDDGIALFDLDLPDAIFIALVKGGVESVEQLAAMTDMQLLAIDGIDAKALKRIRDELDDWDIPVGE